MRLLTAVTLWPPALMVNRALDQYAATGSHAAVMTVGVLGEYLGAVVRMSGCAVTLAVSSPAHAWKLPYSVRSPLAAAVMLVSASGMGDTDGVTLGEAPADMDVVADGVELAVAVFDAVPVFDAVRVNDGVAAAVRVVEGVLDGVLEKDVDGV